jgi:hypothetical protein
VRPRPKLGHCSQIDLFGVGQTFGMAPAPGEKGFEMRSITLLYVYVSIFMFPA